MKRFAELFDALDATTATSEKVALLRSYFAATPASDAAWAAYFLAGGKPRQTVRTAELRAWAQQAAGLPDWLFEECYQAVGDLAETIALVLPDALPIASADADRLPESGLATWITERLLPLRTMDEAMRRQRVLAGWASLDARGRFLLTKLIGGGFRVGVSKLLVQRALAEIAGVDAKVVAERMMGYVDATRAPSAEGFLRLIEPARAEGSSGQHDAATAGDGDTSKVMSGQPYPFFLAHALQIAAEEFDRVLGPVTGWLVEWKYDGIRAQIVRRGGQTFIWSRGEELVTERFPELVAAAEHLPDGTVLDGEILVWRDDRPAPFALLQTRIARKTLSKKVLADAPVRFLAYDVLEADGIDVRTRGQADRRERLQATIDALPAAGASGIGLSPVVTAASWAEFAQLREQSRGRGVEGFMLKARDAAYGSGRTKAGGVWWKWKIDPMSVDCVLVYAQAGHGRRASLYTDYTFAVWSQPPRDAAEASAAVDALVAQAATKGGAGAASDGEDTDAGQGPDKATANIAPRGASALPMLVPFAKAYSGLTDEEFKRVDAVIRKTTLNRFGPVRAVRPALVFELGFEGIAESSRHKSGVAVRFPRMLRIRDDKPLHEANCLADLRALLASAAPDAAPVTAQDESASG